MTLSPRNRARLAVGLTGVVSAVALGLALALIGGPDAGRRDRRDLTRLSDIRQISEALTCAAADGTSRPTDLAAIGPDCLSTEAAARLKDPATGTPYEIAWTNARTARVCARFERPGRSWSGGWPPFDPATGCVAITVR